MNSFLNKKQFVSLLVLLGLVLVLPLALLLTRQRQEVRKKAAGTGVIQVKLTPASTTKQPGDTSPVTLTATLTNISGDTASIRVAGVEFKFTQNAFDITNIICGSSLSSAAFNDIFDNNKIRLVCYVPPGATGPSAPLTIAPGASVNLGSFQASLKASAIGGTYPFSPKSSDGGRTNIPQEVTLTDLSDEGTLANIIVEGEVTGTPTPTPTTGEVTPTPTIPPGECPDGDKGNLNCDNQGKINIIDLAILLGRWSPDGPVPTPLPTHRSADIAPPANPDGKVDILDLGRLLGHWND